MNTTETIQCWPRADRPTPARGPRRDALARYIICLAFAAAGVALGGCVPTVPKTVGLTAAPHAAVDYNAAAPFSIGVIPNRAPPVRIGDELAFLLSANATGYGHLYLLNASGGVLVLAENLPVTADRQVMFPALDDAFAFRATPPPGVERVVFMMTRQPFKGFGGSASGPVQLAMQPDDFIDSLNQATEQLPEQGWALAETRIEIVPSGG